MSAQEYDDLANVLDGQYSIDREIGRGGMGVVYLARDPRLDRPVEIKTLPPLLATDAAIRERFLREARTAARLSHPSIVPIYRADELGGRVFFVMGYVDGESLAQRIRSGGPLPPIDALRLLRDVALALGYAHAQGVVHRDVKAENILIDRTSGGRAMVTDFGIARLAEATPLTATGQVLGTVHYLSPEQASGDRGDGRSDLYSLGVAGFLALSGPFPFESNLASAVLVAHVTKAPPPLGSVTPGAPVALGRIIDRLLAKDPAARFQNGGELAQALSAIEGEAERSSRVAHARPTVSERDAQAIWQRAAELQSMTGAQARVATPIRSRAPVADATRTPGYQLTDVRNAAREAGISTEFVDRALVERDLAGRDLTAPEAGRDVRLTSPAGSWIAGAPTRVAFEAVVDGEMPDRDFDLLADLIRRRTGEIGTSSSFGRSFSWSGPKSRAIDISVVPRNGRTTIHVAERFREVGGGVFGGIIGGGGGGPRGGGIRCA